MKITVVPDQACPGCGAYWGHPDPELDFPNRVKVDTHWRCYNPACDVAFYEDGEILEYELTPEQKAKQEVWLEAHGAWLAKGTWKEEKLANGISSFQFVPDPDAGPAPHPADYR